MGQKLNSNFHNFFYKSLQYTVVTWGKESNEEKLIFPNLCFSKVITTTLYVKVR